MEPGTSQFQASVLPRCYGGFILHFMWIIAIVFELARHVFEHFPCRTVEQN